MEASLGLGGEGVTVPSGLAQRVRASKLFKTKQSLAVEATERDDVNGTKSIPSPTGTNAKTEAVLGLPILLDISTESIQSSPTAEAVRTVTVIELLDDNDDEEVTVCTTLGPVDTPSLKGIEVRTPSFIKSSPLCSPTIPTIAMYFAKVTKRSTLPIDLTLIDTAIDMTESLLQHEEEATKDSLEILDGSSHEQSKQKRVADMNTLYRCSLVKALSSIPEQLFATSAMEMEHRKTIISELTSSAQTVLARVIFLQGPWFRLSQAVRCLERAGMDQDQSNAVIDELLRSRVLCRPGEDSPSNEECDDAEWIELLDSAVVTKPELLALLRKFDPKSKTSDNKDQLVQKLRQVFQNKQTIFGSSKIPVKKHLEAICGTNLILKVTPMVFRLCRRSVTLSNLFSDLSVAEDDDAIVQSGDVSRYLTAARYRGGCRIPAYYSPGFQAVIFGGASVQEEGDSEITVIRSLYQTSEQVSRMEIAFDLYSLGTVLANYDQEETADSMQEPSPELLRIFSTSPLNALSKLTRIDFFLLVHCSMYLESEWNTTEGRPGVLGEATPSYLFRYCDPGFHLGNVFDLAVDYMETRKMYEQAVTVLEYLLHRSPSKAIQNHTRRARWWERLVIDLGHLRRKHEMLQTCEAALQDPSLDVATDPHLFGVRVRLVNYKSTAAAAQGEDESLEHDVEKCLLQAPVIHRLAKPFGKAGRGSGARGKQQFLEPTDSANVTCSVERFALHLYADQENGAWKGIHTENYALREVFALLMGATLLGSGNSVLRAHLINSLAVYKDRCLDSDAPFGLLYHNRKAAIDLRLEEIRNWSFEDINQAVVTAFQSQNEPSKRQKLERASLGCLQMIALCLGPPMLASVCEMYCKEHRNLGFGGAPDLILVRTSEKEVLDKVFGEESSKDAVLDAEDVKRIEAVGGEIKFVEVKSENDRLSDRQVAWMNALHARNIPCEVLKIGVTNSLKVGRSIRKRKSADGVKQLSAGAVKQKSRLETDHDPFESD